MLRLVWPVLLEQVLGLSVGFTDKWLAGNLLQGAEPLAAVGLVAYCLSFLPGLFAIPAVAATALVSRSVGAGDLPGARRAAAQSLLVAAVLTAAVLWLVTMFGDRFVEALGLPSGSTALASRYLAIVLPALPAMMVIHVGVAVLRGAGDMWAGLLAMSVVNLVNAGASFALAVGAAGLPRLGWEGLAWGTTVGYCLGAGCVIGLLCRQGRGLRPGRTDWLPDGSWLGRILHVGVPAGLDALANASCHLAFLSIVNRLGDVAAAAHSVAITIESLAFLPGSAFMVVAATLAGQFLGAGDERRARRSVWLAAMACATLMSVAGIVFLATADTLAAWFVGGGSRQPEVAPLVLVEISEEDLGAHPWPWSPVDYSLFFGAALPFQPPVLAVEPVLAWKTADPQQMMLLHNQVLRAPKVLLGSELGFPEDPALVPPLQEVPVLRHVEGDSSAVREFPLVALQPSEDLRLASTLGFFEPSAAGDGKPVGRVPLVFRYRGQVVPSFVLQAAMLYFGVTPEVVEVAPGSHIALGE